MLTFDYRMELDFEGGMAREHAFTLRCLPQETPAQRIDGLEFRLEPAASLSYGTDSFGNRYCYGVIHEPHPRFAVEVNGKAERFTGQYEKASAAAQILYRQFSGKTTAGPVLHRLAASLKEPVFFNHGVNGHAVNVHTASMHGDDRFDGDTWALAVRIRDLVYETMTYVPGSTTPATSAEEAAARRKGVCQDYAHVMLSLCRLYHIPCRYTAGLLVGEGASHAWVEVCDKGCWKELDPTNPSADPGARLIFSHGRDADDCEINRGIYLGPSFQTQKVSACMHFSSVPE